jgi:hypothetical protein
MKLKLLCATLATVAAGAALYAFQDQDHAMPPPPALSAEHKLLHKSIGTWDAKSDMGNGTMVVEKGPGGFTVMTHYTGQMMDSTFEGRGIDGYDPRKKKFISIWCDSHSEAPMFMEGTWDEKSKTSTMWGEMPSPDGTMVKSKMVTKWIDDDHMDFDMYGPGPEGDEMMKMMTIHYSRKK